MIYTVTFNPALDYVVKLDELQSSDINRTESEQIFYGGKGINVSVILSRLGIENTALGFLAGFSGKQVELMLNEEGVKSDFLYLKNGYTRINVKIKAQKEYDINAQGPIIEQSDADLLLQKLSKIKDGDGVVLAGSIPKSLPNDIYEKILKQLSDKNVMSVVDATGDLLLNVLKYKPFMIKPNHHELGEIFGVKIENLKQVEFYSKELQKMGARNVLVSMAEDGAVLFDENKTLHKIQSVSGKLVNSVGCGDSMVAGFIAGYLKSNDYEYALKLGTLCGSATAFSNSLATKEEIEKLLKFSGYCN